MKNSGEQKPWWNRPISLSGMFNDNQKTDIPEADLNLHKSYMGEFKTIGTIAKTLDIEWQKF